MDSDEFDDGLADEDFILAATQLHDGPSIAGPKPQEHQDVIDLDDWPSDAFASSPVKGSTSNQAQWRGFKPAPALGGPQTSFRQTTLFGSAAQTEDGSASASSQRGRAPVYRADKAPEAPSHHELDTEAMKTWVYPTNLGKTRDYQFSIVKNGLFNNTLVALPTGLGKTFIAATIMLNYFRWTKTAKIVFVAPTKPLAQQQVDACFHIAGIPRSQTTLLTGEVSPGLRVEEWQSKRVFFMTPQTLENDLSAGYADPKSICLLVVDEAHRATGNYSYVKVVKFIQRFSSSFRVLALTATPGSKVEGVQDVIDNLHISHIEIRTEESIDIRPYIHSRDEDIVLLEPSDEMLEIQRLFSAALKPIVDKLSQQNIYYGKDPMALTVFGLMQARKDWMGRAGQHANQGVKFMMMAVFTILQSLAHSIKLLNFHGIKPFYDNLCAFRDDVEEKGQKGSKNKKQIIESPSFREMMNKIAAWSSKGDFVSHPKLTYLSDTVLNHFLDRGEGRENGGGSSGTRIIVFSEFRDSAEEIVRVLNTHKPLVRAAVFVGQADSKKSMGMKQADQIERIRKFKDGELNVLVATSIGEEGLDIGQVDLIVCYDASASPIRMLQRMGRTGRKRAGRAVLLLMKGKEEDKYTQSKDNYEKMQLMICDGSRFAFRHDLSKRIVPRDIRPEVDMRAVEIPVENTQNPSAPEPKRRNQKKKPPKKFHMPDDVETGFTSVASMLGAKPKKTAAGAKKPPPPPPPPENKELKDLIDIPALSKVLLNDVKTRELNRNYRNLPFQTNIGMEEIEQVDVTAFPKAQRTLQKTVHVRHGQHTKRCVKMLERMAKLQGSGTLYNEMPGPVDTSNYHELVLAAEGFEGGRADATDGPPAKKRRLSPDIEAVDDFEDELPDIRSKPSASRKSRPKKVASTTKTSKKTDAPRQHIIDIGTDEDFPPVQPKKSCAPKAAAKKAAAPKTKAAAKPRVSTGNKKTKKGKGAAAPINPGVYDESADEGDDCRRTSDLELSEDSDEGSDLVDFVVGDDIMTSSAAVQRRRRRRSRTAGDDDNDDEEEDEESDDLNIDAPTMSAPRRKGRKRAHAKAVLSSLTMDAGHDDGHVSPPSSSSGSESRSGSDAESLELTPLQYMPSSPPILQSSRDGRNRNHGGRAQGNQRGYESDLSMIDDKDEDDDEDMPSMSQLVSREKPKVGKPVTKNSKVVPSGNVQKPTSKHKSAAAIDFESEATDEGEDEGGNKDSEEENASPVKKPRQRGGRRIVMDEDSEDEEEEEEY